VQKAIPLYEQALEGRKAQLGEGHPRTLTTWNNLIAAYREAGQFGKQERSLTEMLAALRTRLPAGYAQVATNLARLGRCQLRLKKYAAAEASLRECLAIRQEKWPDGWTAFDARSALGEALALQGKHKEAEPLLLLGYEGLKQRQAKVPPEHRARRLEEALQRLARYYEATGNRDEAGKWRKEITVLQERQKKGGR
jgi:tetratricopeptide (TPR) repeat protein